MSIYEVLPVGPIAVPMEDEPLHDATADKPVCSDPTCPCHDKEQEQEPTECEQVAWASAFGAGDGC